MKKSNKDNNSGKNPADPREKFQLSKKPSQVQTQSQKKPHTNKRRPLKRKSSLFPLEQQVQNQIVEDIYSPVEKFQKESSQKDISDPIATSQSQSVNKLDVTSSTEEVSNAPTKLIVRSNSTPAQINVPAYQSTAASDYPKPENKDRVIPLNSEEDIDKFAFITPQPTPILSDNEYKQEVELKTEQTNILKKRTIEQRSPKTEDNSKQNTNTKVTSPQHKSQKTSPDLDKLRNNLFKKAAPTITATNNNFSTATIAPNLGEQPHYSDVVKALIKQNCKFLTASCNPSNYQFKSENFTAVPPRNINYEITNKSIKLVKNGDYFQAGSKKVNFVVKSATGLEAILLHSPTNAATLKDFFAALITVEKLTRLSAIKTILPLTVVIDASILKIDQLPADEGGWQREIKKLLQNAISNDATLLQKLKDNFILNLQIVYKDATGAIDYIKINSEQMRELIANLKNSSISSFAVNRNELPKPKATPIVTKPANKPSQRKTDKSHKGKKTLKTTTPPRGPMDVFIKKPPIINLEAMPLSPVIFSSPQEESLFRHVPNQHLFNDLLQAALPPGSSLKEAISNGDCFFYSVAKELEKMNNPHIFSVLQAVLKKYSKFNIKIYSAKAIRLLCFDYLTTASESERLKIINKTGYKNSYYKELQFTAAEQQLNKGHIDDAIWGGTVEAEIICKKLDIKIHIMELRPEQYNNIGEKIANASLAHDLITATSTTQVGQNAISYDNKTIHLAVGNLHYVPIAVPQRANVNVTASTTTTTTSSASLFFSPHQAAQIKGASVLKSPQKKAAEVLALYNSELSRLQDATKDLMDKSLNELSTNFIRKNLTAFTKYIRDLNEILVGLRRLPSNELNSDKTAIQRKVESLLEKLQTYLANASTVLSGLEKCARNICKILELKAPENFTQLEQVKENLLKLLSDNTDATITDYLSEMTDNQLINYANNILIQSTKMDVTSFITAITLKVIQDRLQLSIPIEI